MKKTIETIFAEEINQTKSTKGCSTCKNKGKKNNNTYLIGLFIFSTYMFATSIYGNYIIFKNLINLMFG